MSVILHKVLSSSLDQDLTRSCISFQAFSLASLMSACSLCTSSTCLLSTSMFRVGFFSCEYNTVWFKKALIHHHSQWSLSFPSPAVPLPWWCDPAVSAFLHNYWNLKVYRFEKDTDDRHKDLDLSALLVAPSLESSWKVTIPARRHTPGENRSRWHSCAVQCCHLTPAPAQCKLHSIYLWQSRNFLHQADLDNIYWIHRQ